MALLYEGACSEIEGVDCFELGGEGDYREYDLLVGGFFASQSELAPSFKAIDHPAKVALILTSPYILMDLEGIPSIVFYENNPFTRYWVSRYWGRWDEVAMGRLPINFR